MNQLTDEEKRAERKRIDAAYERTFGSGSVHATANAQRPANDNKDTVAPQSTVDARLPLEERCRQRWALDPALRTEFHDNYAAFLAYEKANARGQVRRLGAPPL
jgi:hypothetical protein